MGPCSLTSILAKLNSFVILTIRGIIFVNKLMKRKLRRLRRKIHKLPALHRIVAVFSIILLSFFSVIIYTILSAPKYKAKVEYVQTKNTKIAYYVRGHGEPIVLVNGFGMTMQHWDPEFLEELASTNQVIMFDYRGVGASSGSLKDLSQQEMVDDVITLLDALKIDQAHIVGWSLGSFVAQNVAEKHPNRVDRLVLLGTAPGGREAIPAPIAVQNKIDKNIEESWETFYTPMMFADQKEAEAYLERLKKAQAEQEVPKSKGESLDAKVAQQLAFADPGPERSRYVDLVDIKSPTLLITGEKDALTPVANAKKVEARIPNAELRIIPNAGHAVMFEHVEEVTTLIKSFLKG